MFSSPPESSLRIESDDIFLVHQESILGQQQRVPLDSNDITTVVSLSITHLHSSRIDIDSLCKWIESETWHLSDQQIIVITETPS